MGLGPSILASSKSVRISAGGEANAPLKSSAVYEGQRSVRFATSAVVTEGLHEDGYRWRKYGQKIRKGSPFPKSYFRCTHMNCTAKKQLEIVLSDGQKVTSSTYRGQHTHDAPQLTKLSAHDQQSLKRSVAIENQKAPFAAGFSFSPALVVADPNRQQSRLVVEADEHVDAMDDGYGWRKYGQKIVKGTPFPRSYYRCTYPGCNVKKQVRRMAMQVVNSYEGVHTHAAPHLQQDTNKRPKLTHDSERAAAEHPPPARKIEIPESKMAVAPIVPLTPSSRGSLTPHQGDLHPDDAHLFTDFSPHLTFADLSRHTPHELQLFIPSYDAATQSTGGEPLSAGGPTSIVSPHYTSSSPLGTMPYGQFGSGAGGLDEHQLGGHQQPVSWLADK